MVPRTSKGRSSRRFGRVFPTVVVLVIVRRACGGFEPAPPKWVRLRTPGDENDEQEEGEDVAPWLAMRDGIHNRELLE